MGKKRSGVVEDGKIRQSQIVEGLDDKPKVSGL